MKRQRKYKVFSIVALVLAISGMSLGFAAFSKVLTITASATVTPNEEDFKVVIYGFKDEDSMWSFDGFKEFEEDYLSNEIGVGIPIVYTDTKSEVTGTPATIVNNLSSTTISNINVKLDEVPEGFIYDFVIKNEGKYDAYINLNDFNDNDYALNDIYTGTCTIENNDKLNQEAIDAACENIIIDFMGYDSEYQTIWGTEENPYYKLAVGDYITIEIQIWTQENSILSEPYIVNFKDITINFSTSPNK